MQWLPLLKGLLKEPLGYARCLYRGDAGLITSVCKQTPGACSIKCNVVCISLLR